MKDLEICKRIAEIEDYTVKVDRDGFVCATNNKLIGLHAHTKGGYYPNYNPLTDDALCFQLMVKYRITIGWLWEENDKTPHYEAYIKDDDINAKYSKSPNKAILLAIIEANKS